MVRKPELDRERNSVIHLSTAKADCEGIMTSFTFYSLLLVTIQIQRSSSDNSVARLEHTIIFILLGVPHFGPQVSFVSPPATRILLDSDNNSFAFRYPILSGEVIRTHVVFFTNSLQFYLFSFISPSALLLPFYRACPFFLIHETSIINNRINPFFSIPLRASQPTRAWNDPRTSEAQRVPDSTQQLSEQRGLSHRVACAYLKLPTLFAYTRLKTLALYPSKGP